MIVSSLSARSAWIEIKYVVKDSDFAGSSLSARRSWIEIGSRLVAPLLATGVALRKESVDRNLRVVSLNYKEVLSLSARRAWIEMRMTRRQCRVASCRSPQGERG